MYNVILRILAFHCAKFYSSFAKFVMSLQDPASIDIQWSKPIECQSWQDPARFGRTWRIMQKLDCIDSSFILVFPFSTNTGTCINKEIYTIGRSKGGGRGTRDVRSLSVKFFDFREIFDQIIGWRPPRVGTPPLGNPGSATDLHYIFTNTGSKII